MQLLLVSDGRHEVSHYSSGCHLPKTNLNLILVKFFDIEFKIEFANVVLQTWHGQ